MSNAAAAIERGLGARATTDARGTHLTIELEGQTHTLTLREEPRLTMSLPVAGLVGLQLRTRFGDATLIGGHGRMRDPRWTLRTNDLERAIALFDEPPWPEGDRFHDPALAGKAGGAIGFCFVSFFLFGPLAAAGVGAAIGGWRLWTHDRGGYLLTVKDEVATLVQRAPDREPVVAIRMAERLVQVATRPARLEAEIAALALQNPKRNAPYR